MATRNKRKLAALNKENCEEHPRSYLAQNSNVPRSQEDYITQVFQEIEGRLTKKLSQEFSRTENCILGALARLDDILINPLIQGHSGTAPEMSRNAFNTSQATNEDDSQSNPHLEAGLFDNQMTQNSGVEEGHDSDILQKFAFRRNVISVCPEMLLELFLPKILCESAAFSCSDYWFQNFTKSRNFFTPSYKKQGNRRKSCMVIYENMKVIESTIEVFHCMQVIHCTIVGP